ncbi:hypothetical protein PLICRDRAFT_461568 [Plicaturopsis crispa FD-325 SS-3]|nr:hypothetical protein PLICRDRAFT_461568 [Plicaturopsis crispa FD-325 SS-3]
MLWRAIATLWAKLALPLRTSSSKVVRPAGISHMCSRAKYFAEHRNNFAGLPPPLGAIILLPWGRLGELARMPCFRVSGFKTHSMQSLHSLSLCCSNTTPSLPPLTRKFDVDFLSLTSDTGVNRPKSGSTRMKDELGNKLTYFEAPGTWHDHLVSIGANR